jgi:16S rRNA (adenine1518-N6/adenine1519-N6)-dimethyltransferase
LPVDLGSLSPIGVPGLLKRHGLRADKKLGQNFLQDPVCLLEIVRAAELRGDEWVLEIGAGLGSLTRYLALAARQVVAVELDRDLIPVLQEVLADAPNVRIVQGDILKLKPAELMPANNYLVVANIPYYITSAIIRHLLDAPAPASPRPRRLVLTIQKEVAERICAAPGDMSLLALSVQVYGMPRLAGRIPAAAFYPAPSVDSAILIVDVHPAPRVAPALLPAFFQLIKAGFSQKRKTLRNSLSAGLRIGPNDAEARLHVAGIDPRRRAETLSIEEWEKLAAGQIAQS